MPLALSVVVSMSLAMVYVPVEFDIREPEEAVQLQPDAAFEQLIDVPPPASGVDAAEQFAPAGTQLPGMFTDAVADSVTISVHVPSALNVAVPTALTEPGRLPLSNA